MASEQFSLCWDNFHKNMSSGMNSLLENEDLVDVTLAVEGKYLKAHKMVLSVCSPYFRELFKTNPCKHPIVFMKDVSYIAMSDLLQFMYQGEVQVSQENLTTFIKTAEALQIKGLTGDGNGSAECDNEQDDSKTAEVEPPKIVPTRSKKVHQTPTPPAKRPRLSASEPPSTITSAAIAKTEPLPVANAPPPSELIQFKMEPYDQGQSTVSLPDENPDDTFTDDPLDESNADDGTEDYSMMEGGDEEPQAGTSADGAAGEGQGTALKIEVRSDYSGDEIGIENYNFFDSDPLETIFQKTTEQYLQLEAESKDNTLEQDIPEENEKTLPEKSKKLYEVAYTRFMQWCAEKGLDNINEKVLLTYFEEKSEVQKCSSLWSIYSMLKTVIFMRQNVDISKYKNLLIFLKKKSIGYRARKSKILSKEEFARFLKEADDKRFLMMKVALIIGVAGACKREELTLLLVSDIKDEGSFMRINVPDIRTKVPREIVITPGNIKGLNFVDILRKYLNLRPPHADHGRFFVSYRKGECTKQPVGINTFGSIPKNIALFLGLPNPEEYTGHCFRRSSASLLKEMPKTSLI